MSKYAMLVIIGIVMILLPLIGIPDSWKSIIIIALGLCVSAIAIFLRRMDINAKKITNFKNEVYSDNLANIQDKENVISQ